MDALTSDDAELDPIQHDSDDNNSPIDSRISPRSSMSSPLGSWAPRGRSSSVSSQASNDSVNLDALIASGSDINEECPLNLEDVDDVEWAKEQQLLQQQQEEELQLQREPFDLQQHQLQFQHELEQHNLMVQQQSELLQQQQLEFQQHQNLQQQQQQPEPQQQQELQQQQQLVPQQQQLIPQQQSVPQQQQLLNSPLHGSFGLAGTRRRSLTIAESHVSRFEEMNRFWGDSESPKTVEDVEFNNTLQEFARLQMRSPTNGIRGLRINGEKETSGSSRFPEGRNPFDLASDNFEMPAGLRPGSRSSSHSGTSSNRNSLTRLPPSGVPRPGSTPLSGLKPPSRLPPPATRSIAPPKAGSSTTPPKTGIARPSGLQAPRAGSGSQGPKSGLQAPKTVSKATGIARPTAGSTSRTNATDQKKGVAASRLPSSTTSAARPAPRSQLVQPSNVKRSPSSRQSLLPARSPGRNEPSRLIPSSASANVRARRSLTSPDMLEHVTRRSDRFSSHMVSPTSSQSSTSSLQSLTMTPSDNVASLSHRLSQATGTSQMSRSKVGALGRSLSSNGSPQHHGYDYEDDVDCAVLTPPQSPSSKTGSRMGTGFRRTTTPSRLVAPSLSTRSSRSTSPSPLSAGSNPGSHLSMLPRPHTPNSSLPVSRIPSGLVSPRAGRH
ncbi:hypothetical protein BGX34_011537 [Mortierella sp. NVP85]|nr:hypothetical protein BGX34_011537 [Mortierella sp. NVP85]